MTGATALQTNILRGSRRSSIILVMVLGAMAMAARMSWGWCIGAILALASGVRGAANSYLGARDVWSLMRCALRAHETKDFAPSRSSSVPRDHPCGGWSPTRRCSLQSGVYHGGISTRRICLRCCWCRADSRCLRSCARDPRFFDLLLLGRTSPLPSLATCGWKASSYSPLAGSTSAKPTGELRRRNRYLANCWGVPHAESLKRAGAGELTAARHVPYRAHVSEHVVRTSTATTCRCSSGLGAPAFESADDDALNTLSERLNVLWRNIASPNLALWAQVVRRREHCSPADEGAAGFAQDLATKYRGRLAAETLMVNELYLAVVYRPVATVATGLMARLLSRTQPDASRLELADALDACAKLGQTLLASLAHYELELPGVYRDRNACVPPCSSTSARW